jgi:hypothetical protein
VYAVVSFGADEFEHLDTFPVGAVTHVNVASTESEFCAMIWPFTVPAISAVVTAAGAAGVAAMAAAESGFDDSLFAQATSETAAISRAALRMEPLWWKWEGESSRQNGECDINVQPPVIPARGTASPH